MRRDPILGFFGRAGSTPGRGVGRTASGGIGPTRHGLDRGVPRPRPERDLGVGARPAPTASHHLPRGGMGGTCDPQLEGAQARSRARSNIAGPPRGPAPSRRSITGHGAQKAGAHTLCASACATAEGADGRVSTQSACLHRSSVDGKRLQDHAWAACRAACSRRHSRVERRVGQSSGRGG